MYVLLFYGVPLTVMAVALVVAVIGPRFYLQESE
jgi:Flp pilus assembly protein TadB